MLLASLVAVLALSALTAGEALASEKPFVETKPATSITETGATLKGVVNPHGATTKYYFEWGKKSEPFFPTVRYEHKTAEASAGSGTSNVEVSQTITGLTGGKEGSTHYYFRLVAINASGEAWGSEEKLTSLGLPEISPEPTKSKSLTFTAKSEGGSTFELAQGSVWSCSGEDHLTGEFINAKEAIVSPDEFSFCEKLQLTSTEPLKATLGYVNKAKHEVGLRLEPQSGSIYAKHFSFGEPLEGKLIGLITTVNSKTKTFKVTYKQAVKEGTPEKGIQAITEFEGAGFSEKQQHLSWKGESISEENTKSLTTEKEVEIKA
jgi:hypothetical protein